MKLMKPLLDKLDAVIFDLDGTLVDTNIDFPLMKRKMLDLAIGAGVDALPLAELDILHIVDKSAEYLILNGKIEEADAYRKNAMAILEEIELRHARQTEEIPYARELIGELKSRQAGIGIVTRNCRAASLMSLEMTGIQPDVLICREDSERHKPYPDPLYKALRLLGAKPHAAVMVGDHLMDVLSGKAAGTKTIGILRSYRPPDFFDEVNPDYVAHDLKEVLNALVDCNG